MKKIEVISAVCQALSDKRQESAVSILKEHYPFAPAATTKRRCGPIQATKVFVRDGFIDRYSGERLVFPPVFRVLSAALPSEFPYHPNWKTDSAHPAYWELSATVDHLVPVTLGGADDESNWVTTSMVHNLAKTNRTLDELGWVLRERGDMKSWDGLVHWFLEYTASHPETLVNPQIKQWHRAAKIALSSGPA